MGGQPNPKGGTVAKATIKEVVGNDVVFTMEKQDDAQYCQEKIGQEVVVDIHDQ